jgi:integrase
MMHLSSRQGYNVDFSFEELKVKTEDANAVYLDLNELDRLNRLTGLSKSSKAVRDRFLIGCFTALRYSDFSKITTQNMIGNKIVVKTRKTGANVIIPVHPVLHEILARNGGEFPALPSIQSFNATLKRICRRAKINDKVLYERTIGLKVVRKHLEKWTLVTSHTARRSAATNMYLSGIPPARIMAATGHATESAFFRYIRIMKEENAKILSEHPFFQCRN